MKRVFPDREIVELPEGPSGLQLLLQARRLSADRRASARSCRAAPGRRAASSPHLRAILDDNGRPMVFINWNTDMGDGWEWSNAEEYPGYVKYTAHGVSDGDQRNHLLADALRNHDMDSSVATVSAERVAAGRERILAELRKVIVGQDEVVEQVLIALFTGGHCLITGVPGLAKTLLIKTLAEILDLDVQADPVHARPDAGRHHRHRDPRRGRRARAGCAS